MAGPAGACKIPATIRDHVAVLCLCKEILIFQPREYPGQSFRMDPEFSLQAFECESVQILLSYDAHH
jgi:hypothetical protein